MQQIVLLIHVIAACALIGLILIQQGKGAEVGASFGSGASQTIFGSHGSGNFLSHLTAGFATLFFITTLGLGYLAAHKTKISNLDELLNKAPAQEQVQQAPEKESDIPKIPTKSE